MKDKYIIKCPYCGMEYLPNEIYLPKEFFTDATSLKNDSGKILDITGNTLNTVEEYCCDNCSKTFKVSATVSFTTEEIKDDFDDDYVVTINKERIDLD